MRSRPGDESAGVTRPRMARPRHRSGNLPAEATTFVGRRRELGEIRKKLATARRGEPGRPGRGRQDAARTFASEPISRGASRMAPGWSSLARSRDPAFVTDAVLAALDLRDQAGSKPIEILVSYLRERRLLLLIDNCEHLLEAAAQLVSDSPARCARRAGDRHQPRAAAGRGRVRGARPAAGAAFSRWRRPLAQLAAERSRHAVHRARGCRIRCIRAHRIEPGGRRRACAGGSTACRWRSSLPRSGRAS